MLAVENYDLDTAFSDPCTAFFVIAYTDRYCLHHNALFVSKVNKYLFKKLYGTDAAEWTCNYFHRTRPGY